MPSSKRRTFTPEFKAKAALEVLTGVKSSAEACREYALKPEVLSRWKAELVEGAAQVFRSAEQRSEEAAHIAELERVIGRLTLELEVAKKASSFLAALERKNGA
jgi:transposase-like protein